MAPTSRENRPMIAGPSEAEPPYPLHLEGTVTPGFGRGARVLGIPTGPSSAPSLPLSMLMSTANLPNSSLGPLNELHLTGIYFGFARVHPLVPSSHSQSQTSSHTNPTPTLPSQSSSSPTTSQPLQANLNSQTISSLPFETAPYPPDSIKGFTSSPKGLDREDEGVWPMVMSVGWNPYFKNEKITAVCRCSDPSIVLHPHPGVFDSEYRARARADCVLFDLGFLAR